MDSIDLFTGTRELKRFSKTLHEGKATLSCIITERWHRIVERSVKCGAGFSRKLTSRLGIERTEKEELEGVVKGSLGLTSIASFESTIRASTGLDTRLEYTSELEESFDFKAPQCGLRTIDLYQLQRLYYLEFEDTRVFRRENWNKEFLCWVDRIHDGGSSVEWIPECGCEKRTPPQDADGKFYINLGKVSFLSSFEEREGYVHIPGAKARVSAGISKTKASTVNLQRRMVPEHLLFLAREDADRFQARFVPYESREEENLTEAYAVSEAEARS
jgi:hypothetical protein